MHDEAGSLVTSGIALVLRSITLTRSSLYPLPPLQGAEYAVEIDFVVSGGLCSGLKWVQSPRIDPP